MSGGVRRAGRVAALVVTGFVAAVPGAVAQVLTGRVLEEGSAEPVEGALVALLDADSARVAAVLSGPGGRYSVRLPEGDLFRVRVERIGYATVVTPPVARTRASREAVDVALPVEAVSLAPIVATGSGRCVVDPRTALETATLWDQARKVLEVTALVQRDSLVRFRALRFARSLTPDRSVLLDETLHSGVMAGPFRSLSADSLASAGWVQAGGEGSVYYMPDPEVALSESFLDGHCFHIAERERPGGREVGLAFEPLRGRRLPDVSGVLWLDGATGELRSLEYGYTGLVHDEAMEVAGGRAEFERLGNGVWVVRRWFISMPVLLERRRFLGLLGGVAVAEVREEGGELVEVRDQRGRVLTQPGAYRLEGRVVRSDGRPLEAARVWLSGTHRERVTDAEGFFRFGGLPRGDYLLTFHHPLLDTLGLRPEAWPLRLPGVAADRILEVPPRAEVLAEACPAMEPEWTSGVLNGRVVDDATGEGVEGALVEMAFTPPRGGRRTLEVETDAEGWFRFCAVIPDRPLTLRAEHGDRRSSEVRIRVIEEGFGLAHLRLGG